MGAKKNVESKTHDGQTLGKRCKKTDSGGNLVSVTWKSKCNLVKFDRIGGLLLHVKLSKCKAAFEKFGECSNHTEGIKKKVDYKCECGAQWQTNDVNKFTDSTLEQWCADHGFLRKGVNDKRRLARAHLPTLERLCKEIDRAAAA